MEFNKRISDCFSGKWVMPGLAYAVDLLRNFISDDKIYNRPASSVITKSSNAV